jgi:hypothetical protein
MRFHAGCSLLGLFWLPFVSTARSNRPIRQKDHCQQQPAVCGGGISNGGNSRRRCKGGRSGQQALLDNDDLV